MRRDSRGRRLAGGTLALLLGALVVQGHERIDGGACSGEGALAAKLQELIAPFDRSRDFSGAVLIGRGGRLVAVARCGLANREWAIRTTRHTRFAIGSISKTFTAAAIETLAASGRLKRSDSVALYLPDLSWAHAITIEQLLAHTAGVPDYYALPQYRTLRAEAMGLDTFANVIGGQALEFTPGSESRYSNSGYKLLALIVEKVTKIPFAQYVAQKILAPHDLRDSGFLTGSAIIPNMASGYDPGHSPTLLQPAAYVHPSWLEGAGSMYSTVDDLWKWSQVIQNAAALRDRETRPWFGWGTRTRFESHRSIEQSGRVPIGFTSHVAVYPADQLTVVVLSNVQADVAERIGLGLAARALAINPLPEAPKPAAVAPEESVHSEPFAGRYEISQGLVLSVRRSATGLELAGPDGQFLPLNHVTGNRFFFRPLYVPVSFRSRADGRIAALDWAGQFEARKVE